MKIYLFCTMLVFLLLSACTYSVPPTVPSVVPTVMQPTLELSATPIFLSLPTETSTVEPVTLTNTLSPTDTAIPTDTLPPPTATPMPTATSGLVIQIVSNGLQAGVPQAPSPACAQPSNWVAYTVKPNDTLSSLARRTGKSVQKLQAANCLAGTLVFAGQILYIPSVPPPQSDGSYATFPTATVWVPKTGLPGHEKIEVKPRTGSPGTGFEFHVTDYASFEPVRVVIRLDRDGTLAEEKTVPTDREGNLSYTYNSPLNAKPGDYNIFVQGTITINRDGNGSFSITEPSPTTYP